MKLKIGIRFKLFSIVLAVVLAAVLTFLVFALLQEPGRKLEEERRVIDHYRQTIGLVQLQSARLYSNAFAQQYDRYLAAIDEYYLDLDRVTSLQFLPTLNEHSAEVFTQIKDLVSFLEGLTARLQKIKPSLLGGFDVLIDEYGFTGLADLVGRDLDALTLVSKEFRYAVRQLINETRGIDSMLALTLSNLEGQTEVLDEELAKIQAQAVGIAVGVSLGLLVLSLTLVFMVVQRLVGHTLNMVRYLEALTKGELDARKPPKSKDELGRVLDSIESFNHEIQKVMGRIKSTSLATTTFSSGLLDAVNKAKQAGSTITLSSQEIQGDMASIEQGCLESLRAMGEVHQRHQVLVDHVGKQNSTLRTVSTESEASAELVQGIRILAETESESAAQVVEFARKGLKSVHGAFDRVQDIAGSIDQIQGMVRLIASIASQTNLLSMNASIEAAHAGDAGRGFAVVADEIRNLAELAGKSSKDIHQQTKAIVRTIAEAGSARSEAVGTLDSISQHIEKLAQSIDQIGNGLGDIHSANLAQRDRVNHLAGDSAAISKEADVLQAEGQVVVDQLGQLQSIAHQTKEQVNRIVVQVDQVNKTVAEVSDLSCSLENLGKDLLEASAYFS